jgi:hypothetical protein
MKLLGLLPIATGGGVLLLVNNEPTGAKGTLAAVGGFGIIITLGLFAYELHGIKKCHNLIVAGQYLEEEMKVHGQFSSRPHAVGGFINEPFASAIIYPASLVAWTFAGLVLVSPIIAAVTAGIVFAVGFAAALASARVLARYADGHIERKKSGYQSRRSVCNSQERRKAATALMEATSLGRQAAPSMRRSMRSWTDRKADEVAGLDASRREDSQRLIMVKRGRAVPPLSLCKRSVSHLFEGPVRLAARS